MERAASLATDEGRKEQTKNTHLSPITAVVIIRFKLCYFWSRCQVEAAFAWLEGEDNFDVFSVDSWQVQRTPAYSFYESPGIRRPGEWPSAGCLLLFCYLVFTFPRSQESHRVESSAE